ncbi:UDP-glucosyltransferase 2-like [Battus philenor]|uniref:UDP-glucosyltransferase 2-like n=1 Tax=Battus philenor TaxID=42288 RepID=UPI0035D12614
MYKLVSLLVIYLHITEGFNILCLLPYPGKSHHMVFEPILEELTSRGHNLTVVSFFPRQKPHPNRRDISLRSLTPLNVEVIDFASIDFSFYGLERYFEHIPIVTHLAKSNLKLCRVLLESRMFDEFVEAKGNYDLIIVEHFNSDCMLGIVHNYGLPSVGLSSCALLPWSMSRVGAPDNPAYVPGMTLPLVDEMTLSQRIENTFFLLFYTIWYEIIIRHEEQRLLEKKLNRRLPPLEDIGKNASVVLVNTHHSWNGVRVMPPSVIEVGGIHLHNKRIQELPVGIKEWVSNAEHGFIVFSFGSLIRASSLPGEKLRVLLNVFERLPQRIVWKFEKEIDNLPDNVRIMKWIPQYDLLHHNNCVAFITHGGMLSLTEAVSAGVPVLVVPLLGDQFGNAEHAKHAGFARVLRLSELNEIQLYKALRDVLTPGMHFRAKQLSEIWRDRQHSPMDTAIYHIERTARHKGLKMSSEARWLNTLQLALIDIIAFVITLLTAIVLIFYTVCLKRLKVKKINKV